MSQYKYSQTCWTQHDTVNCLLNICLDVDSAYSGNELQQLIKLSMKARRVLGSKYYEYFYMSNTVSR